MAEFSTSEDRRARMSLVSLDSHSERGRVPERSGVKGLIGRRDLLTGGPELSYRVNRSIRSRWKKREGKQYGGEAVVHPTRPGVTAASGGRTYRDGVLREAEDWA